MSSWPCIVFALSTVALLKADSSSQDSHESSDCPSEERLGHVLLQTKSAQMLGMHMPSSQFFEEEPMEALPPEKAPYITLHDVAMGAMPPEPVPGEDPRTALLEASEKLTSLAEAEAQQTPQADAMLPSKPMRQFKVEPPLPRVSLFERKDMGQMRLKEEGSSSRDTGVQALNQIPEEAFSEDNDDDGKAVKKAQKRREGEEASEGEALKKKVLPVSDLPKGDEEEQAIVQNDEQSQDETDAIAAANEVTDERQERQAAAKAGAAVKQTETKASPDVEYTNEVASADKTFEDREEPDYTTRAKPSAHVASDDTTRAKPSAHVTSDYTSTARQAPTGYKRVPMDSAKVVPAHISERHSKTKSSSKTSSSKTSSSALGPDEGAHCMPKCTWSCDSPTCDEVCEPVCEDARCETRCSAPSTDGCFMECSKPHCSVVCSKSMCASSECPSCKTQCSEPQCKLKCPKSQTCKNVCEQPKCDWKCKAPSDCRKPKCRMVCESAKKCKATSFLEILPPLREGQLAVSSFRAPHSHSSLSGRGPRVDATVRYFSSGGDAFPQHRTVSLPLLQEDSYLEDIAEGKMH